MKRKPAEQSHPEWDISLNVEHSQLPRICAAWEARGYTVVAVVASGFSAAGAYASVLVRKRRGVPQ